MSSLAPEFVLPFSTHGVGASKGVEMEIAAFHGRSLVVLFFVREYQ